MFSFDHITIAVTDSDKTASFYSRIFGASITGESKSDLFKLLYLEVGNQTLEVIQYNNDVVKSRQTGIIDHIAFSVKDIDQALARIKDMGVSPIEPKPRLLPSGKKIIFLLGPDGERIELVQHPKC